MDTKLVEFTIGTYLSEMRTRLDQATGNAKAAALCAEAGNWDRAIEIALDIEEPLHEVTTFLNAATTIYRLRKT